MQKHQKRQTESLGSPGKAGLNHAEVAERADRMAWNPGESRSKSCRSIRKGRQSRREVSLNEQK